MTGTKRLKRNRGRSNLTNVLLADRKMKDKLIRMRWPLNIFKRLQTVNANIGENKLGVLMTNEGRRMSARGWEHFKKEAKEIVSKVILSDDVAADMLGFIQDVRGDYDSRNFIYGRSQFYLSDFVRRLKWYCGVWEGHRLYREEQLLGKIRELLTRRIAIGTSKPLRSFIITGSNSGYPDFITQSDKNKDDILAHPYDDSGKYRTAWARTQYGGSSRVVIGGGVAMKKAGAILQERLHQFRLPFTPMYQDTSAWLEDVINVMPEYGYLISVDFSTFDVRQHRQRVYAVMKELLPLMDSDDRREAMNYVLARYGDSLLILRDGYVVALISGIFSGDPTTSLVGSLIDAGTGLTLVDYGKFLSDDAIMFMNNPAVIGELYKLYAKRGMKVNTSKTIESNSFCKFLQIYIYHTRDGIEAIGHIIRRKLNVMHQERPFKVDRTLPYDVDDQDYIIKNFGWGAFELIRKIAIFSSLIITESNFDDLKTYFFKGDTYWEERIDDNLLSYLKDITPVSDVVPNYGDVRFTIKLLLQSR